MTRASLINLAVYSDAPDSLEREHADHLRDHERSRLPRDRDRGIEHAREDGVQAWISAHCHVSRAGSKQVCSEQLSFLLSGSCVKLLPNIVFSHLDSDLPFYLWWQGELPDADRSAALELGRSAHLRQPRLERTSRRRCSASKPRMPRRISASCLCDLNWTRLVFMRLALAQFFDGQRRTQQLARHLARGDRVRAGYRSTAILLVGWLAAQLRWNAGRRLTANAAQLHATRPARRSRSCFAEKAGEPIGRCSVFCRQERVSRQPCAGRRSARARARRREGAERMRQFMPAGSNDPVRLVSEELMRGGQRTVYLRAVERVRSLL